MSPEKRLVISLVVLVGVFVIGTVGYVVVDDQPPRSVGDAIYMMAVTLSTVGYGEAWPLSARDRVWTTCVIIFGIASVSVAFTSLLTLFVSGDLRSNRERRKMESIIEGMHGHVILCGHGRMGSVVAHELTEQKIPLVVIDNNKDGEEALQDAGILYVIGDATDEDILTRPNVVDFVDVMNRGVDLEMDEYVVVAESGLVGQSLGESRVRRKTGATVVAIKRADGETIYTPDPEVRLAGGDTLIIVGPAGVSERLHRLREGG